MTTTRNLLALALAAAVAAATPVIAQAQKATTAAVTQGSPSKLVLDNSTRVLAALEKRRAEFTAERSGELMLFANDAVMPFEMGRFRRDFFYTQSAGGGNFGSACVTIERLDLTEAERQEADKVPPCGPPYQRPKRLFRSG